MKVGRPVLILVSKDKCHLCKIFKMKFLQNVIDKLPKGKINFFMLTASDTKAIPDCFNKYVTGFPSLLILPWKEYQKIFDGREVYNPAPEEFNCFVFGMEKGIRTVEIFETHDPVKAIEEWIIFELKMHL